MFPFGGVPSTAETDSLAPSPSATPLNTAASTPTASAFSISAWATSPELSNPAANSVGASDGSASVLARTKYNYLVLYFMLNLGLTLLNKLIMNKLPFPSLLTSLHAAAGTAGCWMLNKLGYFTLGHVSLRDNLVLYAFSILYTLNIAVSNVSLYLATVPFHQVVRATTPLFIIAIYRIYFGETYSSSTYLSLIPIIGGVGLATYSDYYTTRLGFFVTLLGAILAAIKTVITNRMQTGGFRFSAMEILYHMSPLAVLQSLLYAHLNGEIIAFYRYTIDDRKLTGLMVVIICMNGAIAFGLNYISFTANKKVGALTMTVAANFKQVLTILMGIGFFHLRVRFTNACGTYNILQPLHLSALIENTGIVLTLLGGALYAKVELEGERQSIAMLRSKDMEEGRTGIK
ncbi:MAG: UAA transporter [Pycnora praestabilis]|nr:MAG: UAA transporter [Pycnora praestabilis]